MPFWSIIRTYANLEFKSENKHIFVNIKTDEFLIENGYRNIISKLDDEQSPLFADEFDRFKKSKYGTGPCKLIPSKNFSHNEFIMIGNKYYRVSNTNIGMSPVLQRSCEPVKLVLGKSVMIDLHRGPEIRKSFNKVNIKIENECGKIIDI